MSSTVAPPGGYETALGSISLVLAASVFALFLSNKNLYPLAQREPVLAVISNAANTLIVSLWLFENEHEEMPLVERKITTQICFGLLFVGFFVRTWKLYIDAGLANERVKNKHGWFIKHRHFRSQRFLLKLTCGLVFVHLLLTILVAIAQPQNNLRPAREAQKDGLETVITVIVILCYFISFVVFSVLLAKTKEGFFIKLELRLVGVGSGLLSVIWFLKVALNLPCSLPSCSVFILWVSWLWMMSWSIGLPLYVAMKDPRFGWFRCFTALRRAEFDQLQSVTSAESKSDRLSQSSKDKEDSSSGHSTSFQSYHEGDMVIDVDSVQANRPLPPERLARLKHVPLSKFLTYPAGKEAFRDFTVQEFSVENLLFVEAVQRLNQNASPTKDDATALFEQFVAETGPNQVNLPAQVVIRLHAKIEAAQLPEDIKTCFTESYEHVMKLMQRDAYKRFQQTREWQMHVVVFDVVKKEGADSTPSTPQLNPSALVDAIPPMETGLHLDVSASSSSLSLAASASATGGSSPENSGANPDPAVSASSV